MVPQKLVPETLGPKFHGKLVPGPKFHGKLVLGPKFYGKLVPGPKFHGKLVPEPKFLVGMQTADEQQTIATDLMLAMSSADYSLLLLFLTVVIFHPLSIH